MALEMEKNFVKKFIWCLLFPLLSGCLTLGGIDKQYQALDISDGASMEEAKIIAQQKLMHAPERKDYAAGSAEILDDAIVHQYPDYWFVSFEAKSFAMSFWQYLVVVQKKTGTVIYAGAYMPYQSVDYNWIFKKK